MEELSNAANQLVVTAAVRVALIEHYENILEALHEEYDDTQELSDEEEPPMEDVPVAKKLCAVSVAPPSQKPSLSTARDGPDVERVKLKRTPPKLVTYPGVRGLKDSSSQLQ